MRQSIKIAALSAVSALVFSGTQTAAKEQQSAQSRSCWTKATQQGLMGEQRNAFHATCLKGSLAPKRPTEPALTKSAKAVTAPSGEDRLARSKQCDAEAALRGLHDSGFQAFRKGCLASAAPVSAIGTSERLTKPTEAKPNLESLTNKPPQ
jgi:hypothetical protein